MNRKILISITALLLCFCMAGCSLPSFLEGTFLEYFFNDEEVAPPNYPVTYAGITFDVEPTKIVSLSPAVTEILYDIGLASKLVAKSDNCNYPDSSSTITTVGTYLEPDVDKIIELSANLVITPSALSKSDMAKLNTAGIKVLTLKNPQSLADVSKNIYTLFVLLQGDYDGKINGARYIQNFHHEFDSVFSKLRIYFAENETPTPLALFLLDYYNHTIPSKSIEYYFLKELNLQNCTFSDNSWEISDDTEITCDIIIANRDMSVEALSAFPQYEELDAVKNNDIYHIDYSVFSACGKRMVKELEYLAKALYPSAFSIAVQEPEPEPEIIETEDETSNPDETSSSEETE